MIFKMGDNRMFGKGRTFMEDESCCTTPINVIKSELKQLNYLYDDLKILNKHTSEYDGEFNELMDLTVKLKKEYSGLYDDILNEDKDLEKVLDFEHGKECITTLLANNIKIRLPDNCELSDKELECFGMDLFDVLFCEGWLKLEKY